MIKNSEILSLAELKGLLKKVPESDKTNALATYLKKFAELSYSDSQKLKKEIYGLNMLKLNPEQIIKILDFLPQDAEDIRKICLDTGLDEDEIAKILEIVKEYR